MLNWIFGLDLKRSDLNICPAIDLLLQCIRVVSDTEVFTDILFEKLSHGNLRKKQCMSMGCFPAWIPRIQDLCQTLFIVALELLCGGLGRNPTSTEHYLGLQRWHSGCSVNTGTQRMSTFAETGSQVHNWNWITKGNAVQVILKINRRKATILEGEITHFPPFGFLKNPFLLLHCASFVIQ